MLEELIWDLGFLGAGVWARGHTAVERFRKAWSQGGSQEASQGGLRGDSGKVTHSAESRSRPQ